ncbi:hypothetical protein C0J52_00795 [Blattella germanica]|nr:hypothetical protein C0J52_00795 [Blattella germanica]
MNVGEHCPISDLFFPVSYFSINEASPAPAVSERSVKVIMFEVYVGSSLKCDYKFRNKRRDLFILFTV